MRGSFQGEGKISWVASADMCRPCLLRSRGWHAWRPQEVVILETDVAKRATQETLTLHSIPAAVSKDLLDAIEAPCPDPVSREDATAAAPEAAEVALQR